MHFRTEELDEEETERNHVVLHCMIVDRVMECHSNFCFVQMRASCERRDGDSQGLDLLWQVEAGQAWNNYLFDICTYL